MRPRYTTAAEEFTSFDQIKEYVENYPLPAMPELKQLVAMGDYVAALPSGMAEEILWKLDREFRAEIDKGIRELWVLSEDAIAAQVFDTAVRNVAYLAPGLLEQAQDLQNDLRVVTGLLASLAGQPSDQQLERAWKRLNQYFDDVELEGDTVVSAQDRDEFLAELLAEAEETSQDYLEAVQEQLHETLQSAESSVQSSLLDELDDLAEMAEEEVTLEFDPTADAAPFYNWESMVEWYEELVGENSALPSGPEFKTKSRRQGPRVVDVTHLQEDQQYALQR